MRAFAAISAKLLAVFRPLRYKRAPADHEQYLLLTGRLIIWVPCRCTPARVGQYLTLQARQLWSTSNSRPALSQSSLRFRIFATATDPNLSASQKKPNKSRQYGSVTRHTTPTVPSTLPVRIRSRSLTNPRNLTIFQVPAPQNHQPSQVPSIDSKICFLSVSS